MGEGRTLLNTILRKENWFGPILQKDYLLHDDVLGKLGQKGLGRRRMQVVDDLLTEPGNLEAEVWNGKRIKGEYKIVIVIINREERSHCFCSFLTPWICLQVDYHFL